MDLLVVIATSNNSTFFVGVGTNSRFDKDCHRMVMPCPKRVGSFGSSTRFQMRKVVGNNDMSDIDSVRKL